MHIVYGSVFSFKGTAVIVPIIHILAVFVPVGHVKVAPTIHYPGHVIVIPVIVPIVEACIVCNFL